MNAKSQLRSSVRTAVAAIPPSALAIASALISKQVLSQIPRWCDSHSAVSVYLSMPAEVQTSGLVMDLLSQGRKVYVPLVLGKGSSDMRMVPVENWEEIQGFTLSKWKIPEPPLELALSREDGIEAGDIGLVIAPGCAFDSSGNRLGHGRGYYDSFLHRNADARRRRKLLPSVIVGLALNEQMVDSVPTADHDVTMDHVITPDRIFDCARALRH